MLETRASLLIRIRDPKNTMAWNEFVGLYAPLLHSYGMKNGLQDADAADLAQDSLRNVVRAAPDFVYNPAGDGVDSITVELLKDYLRKSGWAEERSQAWE